MVDGKIFNDVRFVNSIQESELEVRYDRIRYDKETDQYHYYRRGYLVATVDRVKL
jgi:hypothetical protein